MNQHDLVPGQDVEKGVSHSDLRINVAEGTFGVSTEDEPGVLSLKCS